jgi:hypothetical protein
VLAKKMTIANISAIILVKKRKKTLPALKEHRKTQAFAIFCPL